MDPPTQQHSLFASIALRPQRAPGEPPKPRPQARKRRRSNPEAASAFTKSESSWTPVNSRRRPSPPPDPDSDSDPEDSEREGDSDPDSGGSAIGCEARRGPHIVRFRTILTKHHLPSPPVIPGSLRVKHQAAMVVLLHRSLHDHDYVRASRAFGLLMRCKDIDIRYIWSIGLEILLRHPEPGAASTATATATAGYTPENVARAIEFLNRLILEFPFFPLHHAHHPGFGVSSRSARRTRGADGLPKSSALEFYPALFNLLVKVSPFSGEGGEEGEEGEREAMLERNPELRPESIREQIEALMMTPPWTNIVELWLMLGMVNHWIADLEEQGGGEGEGEGEGEGGGGGKSKGRSAQLRAEAETCFSKVREMGGEVPDGAERGVVDDDDDDDDDSEDVHSGEEEDGGYES